MKFSVNLVIAIILIISSGVTYSESSSDEVKERIEELNSAFPYGIQLQKAKEYLDKENLEYSVVSLERCSYLDEYEKPEYRSRGGPCIVALDRVYNTWYGFEASVAIKLWFNSENILEAHRIENVNTFL